MIDNTSVPKVGSMQATTTFPGATWSNHPLVRLTLVRFRELLREPESMFWMFVFPTILAAGLGIAFRSRPPEILRVAAITPELARSLQREQLLDVQLLTMPAAEESLRLGKIALVAAPDAGGTVLYRYDETSAEGRTARMLANRAIQRAAGQVDPVESKDEPIVERGSRYIDFLIPGLIGMTLMDSAVWGVGYPIVDARRKKLMKRLIATPMPRHYYLLSFVLSRLLLLILEVGAMLGFSVLVFQVPVRGSLLDLAVLCVLGSLAFGALGLLLASRMQTIEGVAGLMNLVLMPMWLACGVFFSAQRFPDLLQPIIQVLPLTAQVDALRAIILQGANLAQVGPQLAILAGWLVVCFALAMRLFRWR
jgi:ABC-type polysaccharide/polyol phosphate export permease